MNGLGRCAVVGFLCLLLATVSAIHHWSSCSYPPDKFYDQHGFSQSLLGSSAAGRDIFTTFYVDLGVGYAFIIRVDGCSKNTTDNHRVGAAVHSSLDAEGVWHYPFPDPAYNVGPNQTWYTSTVYFPTCFGNGTSFQLNVTVRAYDLDTQSFTYTDKWTAAIVLYKYTASLGSINSTDKFALQTLVPLLAERDMPPTVVAYSLLLGSTLSLPPLPLGASWGLYYSIAPNMTTGWSVYLMPYDASYYCDEHTIPDNLGTFGDTFVYSQYAVTTFGKIKPNTKYSLLFIAANGGGIISDGVAPGATGYIQIKAEFGPAEDAVSRTLFLSVTVSLGTVLLVSAVVLVVLFVKFLKMRGKK
ncbi:hypothetical protein Pelo_3853 [Pelomyxa schiedti]|nr:hypothetical protein Pelo_3853 [Pelomyxa schiedti]